MKNTSVNINGKEYWISRSVAVVGFIFTKIDNKIYILAGKRGIGADGENGKWNAPCGYLDYDETLKEAITREVEEETNLYVSPNLWQLVKIDDIPTGKQNISISYFAKSEYFAGHTIYAKGTELDEVEDVDWIPIDKIENCDWAFGHLDIIKQIISDYNIK